MLSYIALQVLFLIRILFKKECPLQQSQLKFVGCYDLFIILHVKFRSVCMHACKVVSY